MDEFRMRKWQFDILICFMQHCKIGPMCEVAEDEIIPDYTVIYGNGLRRIDKSGAENLKMRMVGRHVDVLRRLIPSNLSKYQ